MEKEKRKMGYLFKLERKKKGMTQHELAKKLGISERTICRYENGDFSSASTLLFMSNASKLLDANA